jgi:methylene-tetrahydromethanopterin dehydrogenase
MRARAADIFTRFLSRCMMIWRRNANESQKKLDFVRNAMPSPAILHMITPLKHMSPFDVNMAVDAGFDAVIPYTQVTLEEVRGLTQDAIFSRAPADGPRTGLFIAGKNAIHALDMVEEARDAMVGPFQLSVFADPAGSFTTAAAMVAAVRRRLQADFQKTLSGLTVTVFGATGVVGFCAAVISALEGANVVLAGHDGDVRVKRAAAEMEARFKVRVEGADGSTDDKKAALMAQSHVVLACAAAGRQVLAASHMQSASNLLIAADVNAVPPLGIEGVDLHDMGKLFGIGQAVGIGALAIGNIKYQTQAGLFRRMISSGEILTLDFRDAYELAKTIEA